MLKEDRDAQKNDMLKLQIQISSLQRKLSNLSELCEKKDQIIQQKSAQVDSERREKHLKVKEVLRSHKHKIQEIETERQKMAHSYISEIEALKKKQNSVKSGPPGRPLTANRKEITTPQNKVEVSTPPTEQGSQEKLYLEKLQAEEKKTQELIEQIRALQQDRDAVKDEKSQLEDQAAALQAKLQNMSEQCQLKEQALQQKVAQMESERHYCELKIKELVMANEQKVQNIESEHQKTELSYTAEDQLPHAVEEERNLYLKKLRDEKKKTQELEGKILTEVQLRHALEMEKSHFEHEAAALQEELDKMIDLSHRQEQTLQQKVMQVQAALLEKEEEIQRVLQAQSLRIREMEEEREKMQGAYLAQMKAESSEEALAAERKMTATLQNQLDEVKAELAKFQQAVSEPVPDPYGQEMCPLGADVETMESTFADTSDYEVPQNWSFMQMEDSPPSRRQRSYCV
ncbi:hypothetical protein JZ751_004565, partial [Albula glossodonta]